MSVKRAPDFRYYFANAISIGFSENECKIIWGIEEGGGPEEMYEQVGVVMTLKTMKVVAKNLSAIIEHYEKISATEIPFDPIKFDDLLERLNELNPVSNAS